MVADEPHDPLRNKTFQKVGPVGIVLRGAEPFAHVMEERCGVQLGVIGFASRVFEHLERVIERVALGMISRILGDAIEAVEQVEEFFTHRWVLGGSDVAEGGSHPRCAVTPTPRA